MVIKQPFVANFLFVTYRHMNNKQKKYDMFLTELQIVVVEKE